MFPGLGLYFTDLAQHVVTAGWDTDDRNHDLSDLSAVCVHYTLTLEPYK